jgi:hypothetical protein
MPDNWSFVAAAYGLAALVLGGYWRFLRRKERILSEGTPMVPSEASLMRSKANGSEAAARTGKAATP